MIYAANFKMNHTRAKTQEYIAEIADRVHKLKSKDKVFIFPPATALDSYEGNFTVGVQNAYPAHNGAYTGEIGVAQLDEFAIKTILIGHSERRDTMGETQEFIAKKYQFFLDRGFQIIYCVGEPLEIREQGEQAVMEYLMAQFDDIDTTYDKLIVAYEPIWAIGTGRTATQIEISNTHAGLKRHISSPILYGGSVKPDNTASITSIDGVDGVLVGGASLEVDTFMDIVNA